MPAGSRGNSKHSASKSSSKGGSAKNGGGWIGTTISNQPGTPGHRAWTFLNTGVDPGLSNAKDKK